MARKTSKYALTAVAAAMLLALSTGCATTQQIEEIRSMAQDAKQTAVQADQRAASAERKADEALRCCKETKEKIDRMFEKSMRK